MKGMLFLVGADSLGSALAAAFLNLLVALALVSVSLSLGLAVSMVAWVCDRADNMHRVHRHVERSAAR